MASPIAHLHRSGRSLIAPVLGDEPDIANATAVIFDGDSTASVYADLTASGALISGGPGPNARLFPAPSPVANYLLGGSSTIDTARNSLASPGKDGVGKRMGITYPPSGVQDDSYMYLFLPESLYPPAGSQVVGQWYQKFNGSVGSTFAIKNVHVLLFNTPGGGQPQFNTQGGLPGDISSTGKHTTFQVYDNGYEDNDINTPAGADNQANQPIGPFPQDLFDGAYHRCTVSYKPHASPSNRNGHMRMWIDGVKVIDLSQAAVGKTPPGGYKTYCEQVQVNEMHDAADAYIDAGTLFFWGGVRTETLDNVQTFGIDYDIDTFKAWYVS